jgi:hypothetical protein
MGTTTPEDAFEEISSHPYHRFRVGVPSGTLRLRPHIEAAADGSLDVLGIEILSQEERGLSIEDISSDRPPLMLNAQAALDLLQYLHRKEEPLRRMAAVDEAALSAIHRLIAANRPPASLNPDA